ncbi:bifunctional ligase/repressor BirA [Variibacter gotjawalensis]|uniref:biotin--[biotin carboxyl-carrier protein] ligase n=1 Tax=Variibacter gotjawalensis TaxID=1333996 RepID=A0A0S3PWT4_9BRAD|nr:biotin--[acetyl-CoA-carboxylase] ligase [Variibacter gotjawalensis]NIK46066.1 BirA family biotin operon repressor/biotin-[acetyl-CoA-carboxylase] ligase [Variibacter gotjawalensis]RZS47984.1 BirA family biotin operon repressor/biotin-[acetyl-CoA-carboxylase] ligase [Variibacter gotjawalensis]BAT60240.1 bifunctional ligase/repressor BirA [Variibacter gotjawalensis]
MRLDPSVAAQGTRLIALESVGSTNVEALGAARAGAAAPLWITAEEQVAGRGRRGRTWTSPRGNLYATLLLIAPAPPAKAAQLSFVAGLAVHDAIVAVAPQLKERLRLKWPNDVLLGDAKIVGILIEGEEIPGRGQAVVIGIGINCQTAPTDTPYRADSLAAAKVTRESVFEALSRTVAARIAEWAAGANFAATRSAWLDRAAGVGMPILVRTGERELEGTFGAIDHDGGLILQLADGGTDIVSAGEIMRLGAARSS